MIIKIDREADAILDFVAKNDCGGALSQVCADLKGSVVVPCKSCGCSVVLEGTEEITFEWKD